MILMVWFQILTVFFSNFWGLFQVHQLLLVSLSSSRSIEFCILARSKYLSVFLLFFIFSLWSTRIAKSSISFFLSTNTWCGLLVGIWWSVFISKDQRILWFSFSRTNYGLCTYHVVVGSNLNFLPISQWIVFRTQLYVVL